MKLGRPRLPRVRPLLAAAILGLLLALGGAWLWVRDSSLVAVKRVTVTGLSGADAQRIRAALTVAGRNMTTLDVQVSKLWTAVSPFPVVKGLHVSTSFPHGMRIAVTEQIPVAAVTAGSHRVVVAGDGTLLRDVAPSASLPTVSVRALPGGTKLTDPQALQAVEVLAAAPFRLLSHVDEASVSPLHGVVVSLRNGPQLYFGDQSLLSAKWLAAAGVLADPGSEGASYIDVSDPYRPAAGAAAAAGTAGLAPGAAASGAIPTPNPGD